MTPRKRAGYSFFRALWHNKTTGNKKGALDG